MSWLEKLNAAHVDAAQLAVVLREDAPDLAAARARLESLLQRLDHVVASHAVALSKERDTRGLQDIDDSQDWDGPSFRYSPPV